MKLIDNCPYLEFNEAVACGIGNEMYLRKAKSTGTKCYRFIDDPDDKRKVLLEFDSLKQTHKNKVIERFGNPYEYLSKQPIRKMVIRDLAAEKFYLSYRFDENKSLPTDVINSYTTAASWLNMLVKAEEDKKALKIQLGLTVTEFFTKVCEIIEADQIKLPANIIKLRQKIDLYKKEGFSCLIHKLYGKKNAAKIDDEISQSLLLELIATPHADDHLICRRYNIWASENNKDQISVSTVGKWRRDNAHLISGDKYGSKPTYNSYGKHIQRKRPSAPLLLVEHDDNELDLYFKSSINKKGEARVYYFNRFVLCVVIDAFNDYPLGWAYAETYSKDLIKFAYLDAVYHINELTGGWFLPYQIRSDRFGLDPNLQNDLAKFYQSLAIYTPAAVGSARGKYIEQSFGKKWHQVLSCYGNYAGNNLTAKSKLNQDFREENQKGYPSIEEAPAQINQFINILRSLVNEKTGQSRQEQWITAFRESEKSKKCLIDETQLLLKLGTTHTHTNTITNRGITPAINCIERTYEIPEEYYLQTIGRKVQVIYDQMNYSRILVTDNENLMFIAREVELMPSAIADYKPGDRVKLNDRLAEKVRHMETITSKKVKRQEVLWNNRINAESLLMAGIHTKVLNHEAMIGYESGFQIPEKVSITTDNKKDDWTVDDMLDEM